MIRWPAAALIAVLALTLFTCLGCEGTPDASAESEATCAHMSERSDAQCAAALAGSEHGCVCSKDKEAHKEGSCKDADHSCPHAAKGECSHAHAGEKGDGTVKDACTCPHGGRDQDPAEGHAGCPHAKAAPSEEGS
jgi:hypothetical protein